MVGYRQTNQKTDTGKTLTRWPVFVDHFNERVDNARFGLRSKYYVKPAADHPWMTRRTQSKDDVKPPTLPRKKVGPDTTPK
ncbi:hypothetical protein B8Z93_13555 [Klebsiella pneumoniae]|nr:hypothetical protein B8Z93_13555 [Klebsiella pneumoniae]